MNLKQLETLLMAHLQESGQIRTDLGWLKKAFWALATAGIGFNFSLVLYLLTRGH